MYKVVGFDLHGVLVSNTDPVFTVHLADMLRLDYAQVWQATSTHLAPFEKGDIELGEFWHRVAKDLHIKISPDQELPLWTGTYIADHPVDQEVMDLAVRIKRKGIKIAILSNTNEPHAALNRARHLFDGFDAAVMSYEVGAVKPEPAAFHALTDRLNVMSSDVLFIDDKADNVFAARRIGMRAIQFRGYHHLLAEMRKLGVKV